MSPISSPVLIWSDDGQGSGDRSQPISPSSDGPLHSQLVLPVQQEIIPQSGKHTMTASALPAVWRSISDVVSQMKAMQQQVNISAAIHKVMSAILTEVAEVLEVKRKIKEDLAKGGRNLETELEASIARTKLGNRLSDLRQQVAAMQELLASDRPPSEQDVLDVLSKLKVSRIKTIAAAALSYSRFNSTADKGSKTIRSALGLPSLQLRRREAKTIGEEFSAEGPTGGLDSPLPTAPDVFEQIQARALRYSSSFSAVASRYASRQQASRQHALGLPSLELRRKEQKANGESMGSEGPMGGSDYMSLTSPDALEQIQARALRYSSSFSAVASMYASRQQANLPRRPKGIPSLPGQRDMKSKRRAQAEEVPLEVQERILARALQYSGSFSAIALRHASRQASFLRQAGGPSSDHQAPAPIGIPSLPKKRMKSRQRAQAQVDEATWKASCSVLA